MNSQTLYEPVIGLEIHAQLKTKTKLFCGCLNQRESTPNVHTCPVCTGHPRTLPVLNAKAVQMAVLAAGALELTIQNQSKFARKSYFYPDLPKGFQITQYKEPLAFGPNDSTIERLHMEEDAAKTTHKNGRPFIDYNRAGVPLIEIVTRPVLASPAEAAKFAKEIRLALKYLDVCEGDMQNGSFRVDANISLRASSTAPLGPKVEIKNLNSFDHLSRALNYEVRRQAKRLAEHQEIAQETRTYDETSKTTVSMRSKEATSDYRYFDEPDLPPLKLEESTIANTLGQMPMLPRQAHAIMQQELGLLEEDANALTKERSIAEYFIETARHVSSPQTLANLFLGDMKQILGDLAPKELADLTNKLSNKDISHFVAKQVLKDMVQLGYTAKDAIEKHQKTANQNIQDIESLCQNIIEAHPSQKEKYLKGKTGLLKFFVGCAMKRSKSTIEPSVLNETMRQLLNEQTKR